MPRSRQDGCTTGLVDNPWLDVGFLLEPAVVTMLSRQGQKESPSLDKRHRHTGSEKWVFKMNAAVSKCERICRKAYMNSQGEEVGKVLHTTTLTVFSPSDGGRQVG